MVVLGYDGLYLDDTTPAGVGHMMIKVPEEGVAVARVNLVQKDSFLFRVVVEEATMPDGAQRVYKPNLEASVETFSTVDPEVFSTVDPEAQLDYFSFKWRDASWWSFAADVYSAGPAGAKFLGNVPHPEAEGLSFYHLRRL